MSLLRPSKRDARRRRAGARRVGVEPLEGRRLLTTVVALTDTNVLLRVDSLRTNVTLDRRPITGLRGGAGETIVGIDVRPADGRLYALTNQGGTGRLYAISQATGAATLVGTLAADPADTSAPYTRLVGREFGTDFNPVSDRLRVVSEADQNLRINPTPNAAGQVLVDTDARLAFAPGDPNAGINPSLVDVAYSNNVAGASSTTLFGLEGIDPALHSHKTLPDGSVVPALSVVRQGDPGGSPNSPNSGRLTTLGPFGRNGVRARGLDIAPDGTVLVAAELHFPTETATALVLINPASGADQALGRIGDRTTRIRDIAVVPSVRLNASVFAATENGGTARVTVRRDDDGTRPLSVDYATFQGTALAGADFTPVSGRLDFAAGEVTKTIVIPIVNDAEPEGDETFGVVLRNPTGGAVIGSPGAAVVRISANDRRDRTGPTAVGLLETGPSRGITGFTVRFDEDMDPGRAGDVRNFSLFGIGRGGRRTRIPLGSATYDPAQRLVTVTAVQPFMQTQFQQLEFRLNAGHGGLTDASGNRLRGLSVLRYAIFSGTTVTFNDQDGDQAVLSIANGGRLDGIRPVGATAARKTQFWILDPIPLRSTLSGTVRPRGDGIVVIAEIIGLDKKEITPLLSNTSFRVNTLTFSSNATGIG